MSQLLLTGVNSQIVRKLKTLLPEDQTCFELPRSMCDMGKLSDLEDHRNVIVSSDKIVLAHGSISQSPFLERTEQNLLESVKINLLSVVHICEMAITYNSKARIVVIGSESGEKGSFDVPYWLSKAALHSYVRERKLGFPEQQLVCVSPASITDSGMTLTKSHELIKKSIQATSKGRGLNSLEVAKCIHHLLFVDEGYITNTVVEMYGGKFSRRQV